MAKGFRSRWSRGVVSRSACPRKPMHLGPLRRLRDSRRQFRVVIDLRTAPVRARSHADAQRSPWSAHRIVHNEQVATTGKATPQTSSTGSESCPRHNNEPRASHRRGNDLRVVNSPITRYCRGHGCDVTGAAFFTSAQPASTLKHANGSTAARKPIAGTVRVDIARPGHRQSAGSRHQGHRFESGKAEGRGECRNSYDAKF